MTLKIPTLLGTVIITGVIVSACSHNQVQQDSATSSKVATAGFTHQHPANRLTKTVSHTHPNGQRAHTHRYGGHHTQASKQAAGTHTHPLNKCTRTRAHQHANGQRKHSHRYSCQGNGTVRVKHGHYHPANSLTRSTHHNHPNGTRKHTHRYAK